MWPWSACCSISVRRSTCATANTAARRWAGRRTAPSIAARRDDDYLAVVEALLAAGADGETSINRWGEGPEGMASPRVAARLREWAEESC
jgi:hypothetical protein